MAKKENRVTSCMLVQQLKPEYFEGLREVKDGDVSMYDAFMPYLQQDFKSFLQLYINYLSIVLKPKSIYGILHDKDSVELPNGVIEVKEPHFHIFMEFKDRTSLSDISFYAGINTQNIERPKQGRFSKDNMLAYLIHIKYKTKTQYAPKEVMEPDVNTLKQPRYMDIYNDRKTAWEKGASKVRAKTQIEDIDYVIDKIVSGQLTKEEIILSDEYQFLYVNYRNKIENALNLCNERKMYEAVRRMKRGEFTTKILYFYGKSGSGKTRTVKDYIYKLELDKGYRCYSTASSNLFDDYSGEEIILMDDIRGNAMTATEWLNLLDPYNATPMSARYRNKSAVAPRAIFITASIPPIEFFYYVKNKGATDEAMDQFIRRLTGMVEVINYDDMYKYNEIVRKDEPYAVRIYNERETFAPAVTLNYGFSHLQNCDKKTLFFALDTILEG